MKTKTLYAIIRRFEGEFTTAQAAKECGESEMATGNCLNYMAHIGLVTKIKPVGTLRPTWKINQTAARPANPMTEQQTHDCKRTTS